MLLVSCQNRSEEIQSGSSIKIKKIEIDPSTVRNLKLSEVMSHLEYISLETTEESLIGMVSKVYIVKNRFYLFDRFSSKAVFCFDRNGSFLFKIQASGNGPGEFSYPTDLQVDSKEISVWDLGNKKLLKFSLEGDFLSEVMIPLEFDQFLTINDTTVSLYTAGENVIVEKLYNGNLLVMSKGFDNVYYQSHPHEDGSDDIFWTNTLTEPNFFNYSFNDTIFKVTPESEIPHLIVDFGSFKRPDRILQKSKNINEDLNDQGYAFMIHNYFESRSFHHFSYQYKYGFQHVLATSDEVIVINTFIDDILNGYYKPPIGIKEDTLISVIDASSFYENTSSQARNLIFKKDLSYDENPIIALSRYEKTTN